MGVLQWCCWLDKIIQAIPLGIEFQQNDLMLKY